MKSTQSNYNGYKYPTNKNYQFYRGILVNMVTSHYAKYETFRLAL